MAKLDKKIQMLDAGAALLQSTLPFGSMMGALKKELEAHGKVYSDIPEDELPLGAHPCDMLLDYSTPWRRMYISCRLESDGAVHGHLSPDGHLLKDPESGSVPVYRYAVVFNQGDGNTPLRIAAIIIPSLILCVLGFAAAPKWGWVIVAACVLAGARIMISQSKKAHEKVKAIIRSLQEQSAGKDSAGQAL